MRRFVGDRTVEHRAVLEHHPDVAAQRFSLMSRWSMPSMRMIPDWASHMRCSNDSAVLLSGAVRTDEGLLRAGRDLQREMHQRRAPPIIGEVEVVELDVALGAADALPCGLSGTVDRGIEDTEEIRERRHLEELYGSRTRGLVHAARSAWWQSP